MADQRVHDFRTNGSFALPIGPGKKLLGNSSGVLARIAEGWQTARGVVDVTYGRGLWFRTLEAYDEAGDFRATMYLRPLAIWADGQGSVYVSDFGNNRIQKFTSTSAATM